MSLPAKIETHSLPFSIFISFNNITDSCNMPSYETFVSNNQRGSFIHTIQSTIDNNRRMNGVRVCVVIQDLYDQTARKQLIRYL